MTLNGLHILMYGQYLHLHSLLNLWPRIQGAFTSSSTSTAVQLGPHDFGWPLLAVGNAWAGALSALWLRLSWGYRATIVVGVLSLFTLGYGTVLALFVLICLWAPPTRRWLDVTEELNDARVGPETLH
jgi:hypothetical protein